MDDRINNLDMFYKRKFGSKVVKVSLDAGFSCPNKDGKKNIGGCIFCNGATLVDGNSDDIVEKFNTARISLCKKWPNAKYIPFLEANTNTYDNLDELRNVYEPLLNLKDVVGFSIATRCDSISDEVYEYLGELNKRTYLTIELGLQSSHDETLKFLNRGHTRNEFTECVKKLKSLGINVVVHIINGLPNETIEMMLETVRYVSSLGVDGIKFHMLYIEEGTKLAEIYKTSPFKLLTQDEYIDILLEQIKILSPNIVIHRLVSDPNREKLIAPMWLVGKFKILNEINRRLIEENIYQGEKTK